MPQYAGKSKILLLPTLKSKVLTIYFAYFSTFNDVKYMFCILRRTVSGPNLDVLSETK